MHDILFRTQSEWMDPRNPEELMRGYGSAIGLEPEAFARCYDEDHGKERTKRADRAAADLGVRATPTFFINGFRIQGALPVEAFRAGLSALSCAWR